jgi:hypothetical protein
MEQNQHKMQTQTQAQTPRGAGAYRNGMRCRRIELPLAVCKHVPCASPPQPAPSAERKVIFFSDLRVLWASFVRCAVSFSKAPSTIFSA